MWQRQSALWFNPACHRSLYSYQTRTALALAVRYPHIAVTFLPLACTGATIADGLFGAQRARECPPSKSNAACQGTVNGQLAELRDALTSRGITVRLAKRLEDATPEERCVIAASAKSSLAADLLTRAKVAPPNGPEALAILEGQANNRPVLLVRAVTPANPTTGTPATPSAWFAAGIVAAKNHD